MIHTQWNTRAGSHIVSVHEYFVRLFPLNSQRENLVWWEQFVGGVTWELSHRPLKNVSSAPSLIFLRCLLKDIPHKQPPKGQQKPIYYTKLQLLLHFACSALIVCQNWNFFLVFSSRRCILLTFLPSPSLAIIGRNKKSENIFSLSRALDTEKLFHFHFAFLYGNADTWASLAGIIMKNARNWSFVQFSESWIYGS